MPAAPSTTELLPEDGIEATTPPTLDVAELESPHGLERVGNAEHLRAAGGARVTSGVDSSGIVAQSQELSSERTVANP